MADSFFRKLASTFSDEPQRPAPPSQPQHQHGARQPYAYQPPPSASPDPRGTRPAQQHHYHSQPHSAGYQERDRYGDRLASPPPPRSAAAAAAGARSPAPRGHAGQSAAPAAAAAALSPSYDHLSLASLRAEHARQEHTLSVSEMRLAHCLDSEDTDSSSVAAAAVAHEKRLLRELTALLTAREKRDHAEQRVRDAIGARFDGERATIGEHRRQIDALKQRLRAAFAVPLPPAAGSAGMGSPPPARSPQVSPEASLFELLPRAHFDARRAALALEHQNLRIDSIELRVCIEDAQRTAAAAGAGVGAAAGASAPGGPSGDSDSPLPVSPSQWSDELQLHFKSSRKECVRTLQAVLADIDGLTTHLKQAEAFLAFLHPPQSPQQQQAGDVQMHS